MSTKRNASCPVCNKMFYAAPYRYTRKLLPTCSKECAWIFRRQNGEDFGKTERLQNKSGLVECSVCGKSVYRPPSLMKKTLENTGVFFCSNKCSGMGRSKAPDGKCDYCGKEFFVQKRKTERTPLANHFCSRSCAISFRNRNAPTYRRQINHLEADFLKDIPELRFIGDGTWWTRDEMGNMNPDFILPTTNKLVELFGNYWHSKEDPQTRIDRLQKLGYECLVVWEKEYRADQEGVVHSVRHFLYG